MFLLCTCGPLARSETLFWKRIQGKRVQPLSGCTRDTVGIAHHIAFLKLFSVKGQYWGSEAHELEASSNSGWWKLFLSVDGVLPLLPPLSLCFQNERTANTANWTRMAFQLCGVLACSYSLWQMWSWVSGWGFENTGVGGEDTDKFPECNSGEMA